MQSLIMYLYSLSCLFVSSFSSTMMIFQAYEDVTIIGEKLQILTYTRHLWPLNSKVSLAWHTYCGTGYPFIIVTFVNPWHSHLLPNVVSGAVTTCFNDLGLSRLGFEHLIYLRGECLLSGDVHSKPYCTYIKIKVALGVCFALKFVERRFSSFLIFNYLM